MMNFQRLSRKVRLVFVALITWPHSHMLAQQPKITSRYCSSTAVPEQPFIPPSPYPPRPEKAFYVGSQKLWTVVPESGVVLAIRESSHTLRVKMPWFAVDADPNITRRPEISISGRRLDGASDPMVVKSINTGRVPGYTFYPSTLLFPGAGCWEIVATRHGAHVSFIVSVEEYRTNASQ
jgi:hypothetical protein